MKDGGPAFPQSDIYHANGQVEYGSVGMSLRDYFAARASEEDIQHHRMANRREVPDTDLGDGLGPDYQCPTREQAKYLYADAMIEERERGK